MAMTGQREASTQQDINQVKIYVKHALELKKKEVAPHFEGKGILQV